MEPARSFSVKVWNLQISTEIPGWNFIMSLITQLIAAQAESFLPGTITLSPRCRCRCRWGAKTDGQECWSGMTCEDKFFLTAWTITFAWIVSLLVCFFMKQLYKDTSKTSPATVYKRLLSCLLHTWEANFKWFSLTNELWWFEHLENTFFFTSLMSLVFEKTQNACEPRNFWRYKYVVCR